MNNPEPFGHDADRSVVGGAMWLSDDTLASLRLSQYLAADWESFGFMDTAPGIGVGTIRVDLHADGGVALRVGLEDKERGFSVSVMPVLDKDDSIELANTILEKVDKENGPENSDE